MAGTGMKKQVVSGIGNQINLDYGSDVVHVAGYLKTIFLKYGSTKTPHFRIKKSIVLFYLVVGVGS